MSDRCEVFGTAVSDMCVFLLAGQLLLFHETLSFGDDMLYVEVFFICNFKEYI